ncbi:transposase, partial [Mycobacterium canetti]|uniref:transposase n=1 Tax=Mycobacterium canetti TaxID=78331 RepID=UPI001E2C27D3
QAFKTWLAEREESWRQAVEVVAMDGFTGFKTATSEELPDAVAVMDPFHVVRLGGEALDKCRRRVQLDTCGHRGRKTDPMVEGRSKQAFKTWLAEREESWRQAVEVVAMDGFTGFKTATSEGLPDAVA